MTHRAQERLTRWTRQHPWRANYWRGVDELRASRSRDWPRSVYVPAEDAAGVLARSGAPRPGDVATLTREAITLQGLAAWRVTQGVYRFDETLRAALVSTPVTGDLPVEALLRLPEWCVYLEAPGMTLPGDGGAMSGLYAWIDWSGATSQHYLVLGYDTDRDDLPITTLPLVGGTLEASLAALVEQWRASHAAGVAGAPSESFVSAARAMLPPVLSLLLYLCAEEADLGGRQPHHPEPVVTKRGARSFPPGGVAVWDVGARLGARMRASEAASEAEWRETTASGRNRPRPHWRRAHWHGQWHGPKDPARVAERSFRLRWQPPTAVNVGDDSGPVTIHRMRETP